MNTIQVRGLQVRKGSTFEIEDTVVLESTFSLYLNGRFFSGMVASNDRLEELGAGFMICQGLSDRITNVTVKGQDILVDAPITDIPAREIISTGAVGVSRSPDPVKSSLSLDIADIYRITSEIETETWRKTGGVHCSVLFYQKDLLMKASDLGRHNTVDKVVGHAVLKGIDRSMCILGCTGRQPRDMVTKAAHAGIPVIVSRAATTQQGIETAQKAGITLICFSRGDRFTVYTHPERVSDLHCNPAPESSLDDKRDEA
ncbi:MAG: formate dehydrogenase accessory protein [Methanoregulaceae archaeon PtaB.Bin108]|nr:MAG: formate dehydrogenase accessory protein [Methanoregulaceae archaeon PtaB.Bin108]OPY40234.1 MAG: formate dehydrogenase accessory protein [Methanoregulaceae archaeon PtaU1.Bin222]